MEVLLAHGIGAAPSARGHVVVIDVLRAFTCAAFAFGHGAEAIVLVSTTDEALALRRARPDVLLMGEVGGRIIPGFDFGNSPHDLDVAGREGLLLGRTIVQRTGSGTQGVVAAKDADAVYLGSLPVASATCRHLRTIGARTVTLLAMGSPSGFDGPEDVACRTFMADVLAGREPDRFTARREIWNSPGGEAARDPSVDWTSPGDLECATDVDAFDFAMHVRREDGLLVARAVQVRSPGFSRVVRPPSRGAFLERQDVGDSGVRADRDVR
jgi:2-phosphosulfolactate phosphatase